MSTIVATSALGYVYWLVAAHAYVPYEVGLASTLISAMTLISSLSTLGVGATLVHLLPRRESGAAWSATLTVALALVSATGAVSGLLVLLVMPLLLPQFSTLFQYLELPLAITFTGGIICMSLGTVLDQTFVAERASVYMLARNSAFALLKVVLIAAPLLLLTRSALLILVSWVAATALSIGVGMLGLVPRLRRGYRPTMVGARDQVRSMRALLAGNHFITLGGLAPMYLLPVFVSLRLSVVQSAYFYTTWMVASVVFMISPSVASALFAEGSHEPQRVKRQALSSVKISAMLLLPAIALILAFGRTILSMFGPGYEAQGDLLLIILAVAGIPDGITNIYVSLLRVQRRVYHAGVLNLGMAAITLVGAWILLPRAGLVGAGEAWLLAQSLGSVACGLDLARLRLGRAVPTWVSVPDESSGALAAAPQHGAGRRLAPHEIGRVRDQLAGRWADLSWSAARWYEAATRYCTAATTRRLLTHGAHAVIISVLLALLIIRSRQPMIHLTLPAPQPPHATMPTARSATLQVASSLPAGISTPSPNAVQAPAPHVRRATRQVVP